MSCHREKATRLAKTIAHHLFSEIHNPSNFHCMNTGVMIEGQHNYVKANGINTSAIGAYYFAFGYYYILCMDPISQEDYVAIHQESKNNRLMGTMDSPEEIQVFIRDAEVTS